MLFLRSLIIILSFIAMFSGCTTAQQTPKFDWQAYFQQCIQAFNEATNTFYDKDYPRAKELLLDYNRLDSLNNDYESYAFLAECYNQLGDLDSGQIVYKNVVSKLSQKAKDDPSHSENLLLALDEIKKWEQQYPSFPGELKKENGFVPFDKLPDPIGGISGIQKNVVSPNVSRDDKKTGRVLVLALIDETGKAADLRILQSLSKPYDDSAMDAIRKTKFEVPLRKGRPAKMWLSFPIVFK